MLLISVLSLMVIAKGFIMANFLPAKPGGNGGGGTPNPDPIDLQDGEMLRFNQTSGEMEGSGDINTDIEVNFGTKVLRAATGAFDSGSIDMVGYQLNERGGYLQTVSKTTGRTFISLDYQVDNNGSQKPIYDSRGALITRQVKQADDTQTIVGLVSYDVVPDTSQDISQVYFNFVNPADNFRARITSDVTGEVVSYIPSRSAFDKGEGLSITAGEQTFSPETVLPELVGFTLTVEVFADQSIDVLGDALGNPWRAVDVQDIISLRMVDESDIALESVSTSLISGGQITEASPTTIDIAAGRGRIVSIDAQGVPTVTEISWGLQSGVAITNIATQIATRIVFDSDGLLVQLPPELTPEVARDYVNVGFIGHSTGTIGAVLNDSLKSQEIYSQFIDGIEVLGVTRKKGLAVSPNADLSFNKTSGEIQSAGGGNDAGTRGQNIVRISGESPSNFSTFLGTTDDVVASSQTLVDPGFYDNGTGTKVAIGTPIQQATIQYVYQSIIDPAGVLVMYGQTVYPTVADALLNADLDVIDIPITIQQETNLIARIVVSTDAINLQDDTKAVILSGVKFGSGIDGTLSGSISGGGDYLGAASSSVDELHTFADASGKVGKAGSDVSALNGTIKRIGAGQGLSIHAANGISGLDITDTQVELIAKNGTDTSTTNLKVTDSNGNGFGGGAVSLDTGNSVGYKSSQGGIFRNQMYYVATDDETHFSHNGTNSLPNADMVMANTSITTEFSGAKAMSIDSDGHLGVDGASPEINLIRNGTAGYTWDDASGTMRLGRTGFGAANARLEMEFGFTTLNGGDAGWARLKSGNALVRADGTSENVEVNSNTFGQGDAFVYPVQDENPGDRLTTDGAGNLTLQPDNFELAATSATLDYENKQIYIDSAAGNITLTLGDNPRVGERKLLWMGDNTNEVTLVSANPAFPLDPQTPPAEANIQGMWTLTSDFLDRFSTDRDMSNVGTGGAFVPVVVNGNNVNAYDFQGTSYLSATASGYEGILGGSARSVTCWYQATAGEPTTDQTIVSWGEDIANGGGSYWEIELRSTQGYLWVNNRNAWRRFPYADLNAVNLFDGNMHHIAVTQSTSNMGSVVLYVDGVRVLHTAQDTFPNCNTLGGNLLKIGAGYNGNQRLDAILYDVRLFNRALTLQEVDEVRNENILGGINLSALNNDMVIDVTYNGAEWKLGVGTESLLGSVDGRLTSLEDSAMRGAGASTANNIVTFADDTGNIADNASGVSVFEGLFVKDGIATPNLGFRAGAGGDINITTDLNNIELNDTTGNINISDGADGNANFFFGGIRLSNPSDSPHFEFADSGESVLAGMQWETADGGYNQFYHGNGFSVINNDLRMYANRTTSSRGIDITSTTEAFFPPRVTTAQMNAITPTAGATAFNTDLGLPVFGNGTSWNTVSTTTSVSGKTNKQDGIVMTGIFQAIASGTFDYYEVDGTAATPNFTNGAWVVDVGGTYNFNIRGWAFNNTGTENQARFYVGVNGNDYVSQPDVGIDVVTKDGSGLTLSGQVKLTAGDVVRIGYSVLSGTGWELDAFTWDVTRTGS